MKSLLRPVGRHGEAVALACVLLATVVFGFVNGTGPVPASLYGVGVIGGASIALQAVGIVLVYRSTQVINFAQIQMGVAAGTLFVNLVTHRTIVRGVGAICPPCLPHPHTLGDLARLSGNQHFLTVLTQLPPHSGIGPSTSLQDPAVASYLPSGFVDRLPVAFAPSWLTQFGYWVSMLLAVLVATLLVWAVYAGIIRRFTQAPKLVLTVVTIAAGFFIEQLTGPLMNYFFGNGTTGGTTDFGTTAALPVHLSFTWSPSVFSAADMFTLVVTALAVGALVVFLRRSPLGLVMRGAAENPSRAQTLGINVASVTGRAWMLAGALSGIAAVLAAARTGSAPDSGGYDVFVRTLAAAVGGGLLQLPLTLVAGLLVGVTDIVFAWGFGSEAPLTAVLLVVIVALLLAQRARTSRADREAAASWQASREIRPIPLVLRSLPPVRTARRGLITVGSLLVLGYPWFMSPTQTNIAVVAMVEAMIGLSLLILTGWAGQISLGQMGFAAVGAWVAAVLQWPFFFSLLAGATAGMIVAVAVGIPSLRLRGLHLAISTLAFGVAATAILFDPRLLGAHLPARITRPMLLGLSFENYRDFYYLTVVFLAVVVLAVLGLRRSAVARALISAKDNEQATMSFGISLLRTRVVAFAVSGAIAAFAGALFAYSQHGVVSAAYSPDVGVSLFLMVLLGGMNSVAGPLVGAAYLAILQVLSTTPIQQLTRIVFNPGIGVLLLLLVMPGGLMQGVVQVRDAWLRRVATRYRLSVPSLGTDDVRDGPMPIKPLLRASGGETFVPARFRLDGQWVVQARRARRASEQAHV